jgi:DNA-binding winged helix-turn-helix (wHTH) protein
VNVRFGPFEVDSDRRQLLKNGVEIHLAPKAFDLLALLVANAPRVVRKKELHERLWPDTFVSDATLVGLVKDVRRALDDRDSSSRLIRTAHGVGYAFAGTNEQAVMPRSGVRCWIVAGRQRIPLTEGEHLVGRDPETSVFLDVAGVSRRHARIVIDERGAFLEDLRSKNGTKVQDVPVSGAIALRDGDRVQVGPALIVFRTSMLGPSTETLV